MAWLRSILVLFGLAYITQDIISGDVSLNSILITIIIIATIVILNFWFTRNRGRWIPMWSISLRCDDIMPLRHFTPYPKAVEKAYEATSGTVAARIAEQLNEVDILGYYAHALFNHRTLLYGSRPELDVLEAIPTIEEGRCRFSDDYNALIRFSESQALYKNLHIRTKDLKHEIKRIKTNNPT